MVLLANFRKARRVSVLEITVLEGEGTVENIYREVTFYLNDNGDLLAVNDIAQPWERIAKEVTNGQA